MRPQLVVRLTEHQVLRCEKLGEHLWLMEKLSVRKSVGACSWSVAVGRVGAGMVEVVRSFPQGA